MSSIARKNGSTFCLGNWSKLPAFIAKRNVWRVNGRKLLSAETVANKAVFEFPPKHSFKIRVKTDSRKLTKAEAPLALHSITFWRANSEQLIAAVSLKIIYLTH